MTPYYQDDLITLYLADCLPAMREMPDKAFELSVVDVPYGIGESMNDNAGRGKGRGGLKGSALAYAKDYGRKDWDKSPPPLQYFKELLRVSKNQIIWGANHFIDQMPVPSPCWIVWDKVNYGNDFADCELAWTSFRTAVRQITFQWNGLLQGDMKNKEIRIHQTQKPVALYRWLLKNYAKPGDTILDTHLGSGSIAIACHDLGFKLTGFEIDEEYLSAAVDRIKRYLRQPKMFKPVVVQPEQESFL